MPQMSFLTIRRPRQRLLVELDDAEVVAADNEKRRRAHDVEGMAREVGPSAARDDGADSMRKPAAATRAAAAPVLAPNSPIGSFAMLSCPSIQCTASTSRSASSAMLNTLARLASSAGSNRSNNKVAMPCLFRPLATARLRG